MMWQRIIQFFRILPPTVPVNCSHLFGLQPYTHHQHITLADVEDIYPIANEELNEKYREAIYMTFGMDMRRIEQNYPQVKHLNACWNLPAYNSATTHEQLELQ